MAESETAQSQPTAPQPASVDNQVPRPGTDSLANFGAPTEVEWLETYWRKRHSQVRRFPLGDH